MTTTQITNIAHLLDLTAYAGDFIDDYDMDAVHHEYVELLNRDLPDGITLHANGDVIAEVDLADQARDIDWEDLTNERNVAPIFERHDNTANLLPAIVTATQAVTTAERQRVSAIRAAKESGRFTVEEIALAANITRDGVYKLLNRNSRTIRFGDPAQAQFIADMLAGNGHKVDIDGITATLSADALEVLAQLPEDYDGHFDGTYVWVGGTEYRIEG